MPKKTKESLRSARWFAPDDLRSFGHRSRAMQMGYGPEDWAGKPVIAIITVSLILAIRISSNGLKMSSAAFFKQVDFR